MNYLLINHNWSDDIVTTVMMFFPNEKYTRTETIDEEGLCLVSSLKAEGGRAEAVLYRDGSPILSRSVPIKADTEKARRYSLRMSVFHCLAEYKPTRLPWGALTGVRPAKLVRSLWEKGFTDKQVYDCLKNDYLVWDEKISLVTEVAKNEQTIVSGGSPDKIGIYIGIPFCPTRCLYCSFTSYPLGRYGDRVDSYLDALEKEMEYVSGAVADKTIESLYIGGGTPTALDERQLDRLLEMVNKYFKSPMEYTVEAGRPDTITRRKLKSLKEQGVGRISINPQTLNNSTLQLIGRQHSAESFISAFEAARAEGHRHINTDIILGLPGEDRESVTATMEGLSRLSPESITVHTLAVKRASRLRETLESYRITGAELMEELLNTAAEYTRRMGMHPYYMYRQKNMVGNFENTGYCKQGCECVYNVQIMEEKQSIWALGAGASTKLVDNRTDRIERIFNVKSVDDYISRIDEMIERKRAAEGIFDSEKA